VEPRLSHSQRFSGSAKTARLLLCAPNKPGHIALLREVASDVPGHNVFNCRAGCLPWPVVRLEAQTGPVRTHPRTALAKW
jgi:hypothetical protein